MKTIVLVLVSFFFGMLVGAQEMNTDYENKFDVQLTAKNEIVVRHIDSDGEKVKVYVYNSLGERVGAKTIKNTGNAKVYFDLSNTSSNEFIFKIVKDNKVVYAEQVNKLADGSIGIPEKMPESFYDAKRTNTIYISKK